MNSSAVVKEAVVILDTHIILDMLLFSDAQVQPVREALAQKKLTWIASLPMREELERVLEYPKIAARRAFYQRSTAEILAQFDAQVRLVAVAPRTTFVCKDADDQKFIDLAVAFAEHSVQLISKDHAVLALSKRLSKVGVVVAAVLF